MGYDLYIGNAESDYDREGGHAEASLVIHRVKGLKFTVFPNQSISHDENHIYLSYTWGRDFLAKCGLNFSDIIPSQLAVAILKQEYVDTLKASIDKIKADKPDAVPGFVPNEINGAWVVALPDEQVQAYMNEHKYDEDLALMMMLYERMKWAIETYEKPAIYNF